MEEETYERGLRMLAGWLQFLAEKEQELQEQLARMQAQSAPAPPMPSADDWLDESPPAAPVVSPAPAPAGSALETPAPAGSARDDEIPDWLR